MGLRRPRPLATDAFVGPDWKALVCAYQASPSAATSTPLLAALEPGARWCLETLAPDLVVDADDLWQQLQLSLLERALELELSLSPQWIPVRLLQEARRSVRRYQRQQRLVETEPLDPGLVDDLDVEEQVASALAATTRGGPVFRKAVLKERYTEQARREQVTPAAMWQRASRERARLRRRLSATKD